MNTYRFPYLKVSNPTAPELSKFRYQPIKKIALSTNGSFIKTEGYIDTGAQWCLFNSSFAKQLGIKDYTSTNIRVPLCGIGGREQGNLAHFHKLNLYVFKDDKRLNRENAWKIETTIGFLDKEIGFAGILGVYGFLDQFVFQTNIPDGYFELTPIFDVDEV